MQVEPVRPGAQELTEEEKAELAKLPSVPQTRPEPSQLQNQTAKAQKEADMEQMLAA